MVKLLQFFCCCVSTAGRSKRQAKSKAASASHVASSLWGSRIEDIELSLLILDNAAQVSLFYALLFPCFWVSLLFPVNTFKSTIFVTMLLMVFLCLSLPNRPHQGAAHPHTRMWSRYWEADSHLAWIYWYNQYLPRAGKRICWRIMLPNFQLTPLNRTRKLHNWQGHKVGLINCIFFFNGCSGLY